MSLLEFAPGWTLEVERGPDWLFVKLRRPKEGAGEPTDLAESLWSLLERHFVYRLVLELDDLPILPSYLIGQLILVYKRIHTHDGLLRLCGLSEENRQVLHATHLHQRLPHYRDRTAAVIGDRPAYPR